jgi:hypothetical protein
LHRLAGWAGKWPGRQVQERRRDRPWAFPQHAPQREVGAHAPSHLGRMGQIIMRKRKQSTGSVHQPWREAVAPWSP